MSSCVYRCSHGRVYLTGGDCRVTCARLRAGICVRLQPRAAPQEAPRAGILVQRASLPGAELQARLLRGCTLCIALVDKARLARGSGGSGRAAAGAASAGGSGRGRAPGATLAAAPASPPPRHPRDAHGYTGAPRCRLPTYNADVTLGELLHAPASALALLAPSSTRSASTTCTTRACDVNTVRIGGLCSACVSSPMFECVRRPLRCSLRL